VEKQLQYTTEEWERRLGADARRLRLAQGVTQVELAQRANVSVSALKYLEWGRGSTLTTLIRVARAAVTRSASWTALTSLEDGPAGGRNVSAPIARSLA
jgi:transcriptional regulator with XRE-family HTH domain